MPPHQFLLGHLPLAASIFRSLPVDAHPFYLADQIRRRYPQLDSAFYLDLWPFGPPTLMVISPQMAQQFTQDRSLPKHPGVRKFLEPLTGKHDLVSMEGLLWKRWRALFNPGFSMTQIRKLVPGIVEQVLVFRGLIQAHAEKGDLFRLEEYTLRLSVDIIGKIVLDHNLNDQKVPNSLAVAMRHQQKYCTFGIEKNPFQYINIARPFIHRYNTWRMNSYIENELDMRYTSSEKPAADNCVVDLALQAYLSENPSARAMDTTFKDFVISQVKLFLQAGSDTTASTAVYVYYLLSKHPAVLVRLRAEHMRVFGEDIRCSANRLISDPSLLNDLPFTKAVIKETLRLFPAASTARMGDSSVSLIDPSNMSLPPFPTAGCLVWSNHQATHRNPRYWPHPTEFLPDRWLVSPGHPLYPAMKHAWRPFEHGPRNCLGQELAIVEIKIMLVLTVRDLEIRDAYQEWDLRRGRGWGWGEGNSRVKTVEGERAFQIMRGGGHPSDFFPCRVKAVMSDSGLKMRSHAVQAGSISKFLGSRETLARGYNHFSIHSRPFAIRDLSFKPQVILPSEHVAWLVKQPESRLSQWKARLERNAISYLAVDVHQKSSMDFIDKMIGHCLTRNLDRIQPDMVEEIHDSVDSVFSSGRRENGWSKIDLSQAIRTILFRTGNRAFFGLPTCRDESYLRALHQFIISMGITTLLVGILPPLIIRPIIGSLLNLVLRFNKWRVLHRLIPVIAQRKKDLQSPRSYSQEDDPSQLNDFITHSLKVVIRNEKTAAVDTTDAEYLAEQYLFLTFAALTSLLSAAQNVFLDILSAPNSSSILAAVRDEALSAAPWTDATALKKLPLIDSTIKESLRLNPIQTKGLLHEVNDPNGLTLPDGTHLPRGAWVAVPAQEIQRDKRFYQDAQSYKPFRFADGTKEADATYTSETYLAFSYGRHAW
ncbi:MAG: hypothetical protein Q9227_006761 [Pyrenula ochraceoflavens]